RGRHRLRRSEHAGRAARAQYRLADLRQSARDLHLGRDLAARPAARRDRRDRGERPRHVSRRPRGRHSALSVALAQGHGLAVVRAAWHGSHGDCGHGVVADGTDIRMTVFLGIDVGGSHTTVVVGDKTAQVIARADGPGAAMRPGGAEASAAVIADVARRAAAAADITLPADAAMVGAAGAGREQEQHELAAALIAAQVARRVRVAGDSEISLAAAFGDGPGILLNAGTGSIAFARSTDASLHRAG